MRTGTRQSLTTAVGGERVTTTPTREFWSSRTAFYFATSGAAIGFGNVWRFPALCVEYGGGAFFIPYLVALLVIGFPLTILEIGFGQYFQTGDIGVFGKMIWNLNSYLLTNLSDALSSPSINLKRILSSMF